MALAYSANDLSRYSVGELMVCEMSRWLTNGDTVAVWDDSPLGVAAARLAQMVHAPDLTLLLLPVGAVNPAVEPLTLPLVDYSYLAAEAVIPWEQALSVLIRGVDVAISIVEGMDQHGDIVSSRGGLGPVAFPWLTAARRTVLYVLGDKLWQKGLDVVLLAPAEKKRRPGYRLWRAITYLGSFEPYGRQTGLRLRAVHPGFTVKEVVELSGIKFDIPETFYTTQPPTKQELEMLRKRIDPNGLLRDIAG